MSCWRSVISFVDPDRYVTSEGKEKPELLGAMCSTAGVLLRVRWSHGEWDILLHSSFYSNTFPNCFLSHRDEFLNHCLLLDVQEDSTNPYVLTNPVTPALPAFPRVTNTYGSYQDSNIPFPRTSGARFCGTGSLG